MESKEDGRIAEVLKHNRLINNVESIFNVARKEMYANGKTPEKSDLEEFEDTLRIVCDSLFDIWSQSGKRVGGEMIDTKKIGVIRREDYDYKKAD